jgi:hypothetical protein
MKKVLEFKELKIRFSCLGNCLNIEDVPRQNREFVNKLFENLKQSNFLYNEKCSNRQIISQFKFSLNQLWNDKGIKIEIKTIEPKKEIPIYELFLEIDEERLKNEL